MEKDVQEMARWDLGAIVDLLEPHEKLDLGLWELDSLIESMSLKHYLTPIEVMKSPRGPIVSLLRITMKQVMEVLATGKNVAVFCDTDMGRSGLAAAQLLADGGMPISEAIQRVRACYYNCIETPDQEDFLRREALMIN